jgi:hypothetical protein
MTTDKELVIKLRNINWAEYNLKVEEFYSKLLDELLPEYSKIKKIKGLEPIEKDDKSEEEDKE